MSQHRMRWCIAGALVGLMTIFATALALAQTAGFQIVSVTPSTINPTKGEVARVTYTVPTKANYTLYVRNSAGTTIKGPFAHNNESAGTKTTGWSGNTSTGQIAPDGVYALVISGTTTSGTPLLTGIANITVKTTATTAGAFVVTSVTPSTIDPSKGQIANVTYTVPTTANYNLYVRNSAGMTVKGPFAHTNEAAGTKTTAWGGKDANNAIVPDGAYQLVLEGKSTAGVPITTGVANITVKKATATTGGAFAVTGVSPSTIDATTGQVATVTYTVPIAANYTTLVRNSAGTTVQGPVSRTNEAAGTKTTTWNGRNNSGSVVPDGTYTMVIAGTSTTNLPITTATATITVKTATIVVPPPPPPPTTGVELGQVIEGQGCADYEGLRSPSGRFGIAFRSPKSGTVTQALIEWMAGNAYGGGTLGVFTFELQTNSASGLAPSGTVIGRTTGIRPATATDGRIDGAFRFPISATLTAGQIYHLVIANTDPSPSTNWSSPNTMMSRVFPWDVASLGNPASNYRGEYLSGGTWRPWTSVSNFWNTARVNSVNGSHTPLILTWSDGTSTGDSYYGGWQAGGMYLYGSNKYGEYIYWNQPSATIRKIGVPVGRRGTAGSLIYHLEKVGSGDIATGTLPTSGIGSVPTWTYATLPSPVTLMQGQAYRLWFESPNSTSSSNCYYQYVPYGDNTLSILPQRTWGGSQSYYTKNTGGSWVNANSAADISFSLQ